MCARVSEYCVTWPAFVVSIDSKQLQRSVNFSLHLLRTSGLILALMKCRDSKSNTAIAVDGCLKQKTKTKEQKDDGDDC